MNRVSASRPNLVVILLILSCIWALINGGSPVHAHSLNNGYSQINVEPNSIQYDLFIPESDLLQFDTNGDKKLSADELQRQKEAIAHYLELNVRLEQDMQPMPMQLEAVQPEDKDAIPGVSFSLHYTPLGAMDGFTIEYNLLFEDADPLHVNFVLITEGDDVDQTVMDSGHRSYHYVSLHPASMIDTLWKYLKLGVEHIWTGYDHLLFLGSLLLVATRWKEILKIVTAFTAAHSITLLLAAMNYIRVPSVWVETGIALTICYVAIENMIVRKTETRWLLAFLFGLIHGMGFAGALKEIGLPQSYFVESLLTFNLGVEAGQLVVVAVLMPLLLQLQKRKGYRKFMLAGSALVLILAAKWSLERLGIM